MKIIITHIICLFLLLVVQKKKGETYNHTQDEYMVFTLIWRQMLKTIPIRIFSHPFTPPFFQSRPQALRSYFFLAWTWFRLKTTPIKSGILVRLAKGTWSKTSFLSLFQCDPIRGIIHCMARCRMIFLPGWSVINYRIWLCMYCAIENCGQRNDQKKVKIFNIQFNYHL